MKVSLKSSRVSLKSYIDDVVKDIDKDELKTRRTIAQEIAKQMKKNVSGGGFKGVGSITMKSLMEEDPMTATEVIAKKREVLKNVPTSQPGQFPITKTGFLQRGIVSKGKAKEFGDRVSIVGFQSPAFHAHLLEFGHGDGKEQNKRPFFRRTFDEMGPYIEKKLQEPWLERKEIDV